MNIGLHDVAVASVEISTSLKVKLIEEERLTRIKNKGGLPYLAIKDLAQQIDLAAIPQEQFSFSALSYNLEQIATRPFHSEFLAASGASHLDTTTNLRTEFTHHECHLFSMLPLIVDRYALIVVADGCGSRMERVRAQHSVPHLPLEQVHGHENISVYLKHGTHVECIEKITHKDLQDIPGLLENPSFVYERTSTLIFGSNKYAGKVMGLASLKPKRLVSSEELKEVLKKPLSKTKMTKEEFDSLSAEELQWRVDLSHSAQIFFQNYFIALFENLQKKYPTIATLAFVGGCALNCPLNTMVVNKKMFKNYILSPFPNDEGIAIGAALANAHKRGHYKINRHFYGPEIPFLGASRDFSPEKVASCFKELATISAARVQEVAELLANGEVVAWIEGRSEAGPRALGHRSLFASPFHRGVKKKLNDSYKFREAFRPYGVSVLRGDVKRYFDLPRGISSPFMSLTPQVKTEQKKRLKEVLQPDGSIRIQTVDPAHRSLAALLRAFKREAGDGVLIHTSLNVMNEPIIETIEDAVKFFVQSPIKYMVIEGQLLTKHPSKKSKFSRKDL